MAHISEITSTEYGLWGIAIRETSKSHHNKIVDLEKSMKSDKDSLAELSQKYLDSSNFISRLYTQVTTNSWKSYILELLNYGNCLHLGKLRHFRKVI